MRIVRYAETPERPWKNGGGVSRIIATSPANVQGYSDDVLWHVSLPEIAASGPFSSLPGFDRQFLILEGAGVELHCVNSTPRIDITQRCDKPLEVFAFQGEWQTDCRLLAGKVIDLSVLTRRGRCGARVEVVEIEGTIAVEKRPADECVVLIASGAARLLTGGQSHDLGRYDSIVGAAGAFESYSLSRVGLAPARAVVVRLAR